MLLIPKSRDFRDELTLKFLFNVVLVAQSFPTLCDPTDCSPPVSSVHGILQARTLEWITIPFSRGSSWPRDQTQVSCIADKLFTCNFNFNSFLFTHFYSLVFILQPWQTPAGSPLITLFHSTGPLFMFSFCLSFQSTPFFTWLTYNHVDLQEASLIFFCSLTYFPFLHSHNT